MKIEIIIKNKFVLATSTRLAKYYGEKLQFKLHERVFIAVKTRMENRDICFQNNKTTKPPRAFCSMFRDSSATLTVIDFYNAMYVKLLERDVCNHINPSIYGQNHL